MSIVRPKQRRWRQAVSCFVAYAFALYVALAGFAAAGSLTFDAAPGATGTALCLHDGGEQPLAPADNSGGDEHCKFCTASGHQAFTAPAMVHQAAARAAEPAVPPSADPPAFRPRAHAAAQPRGPPRTA